MHSKTGMMLAQLQKYRWGWFLFAGLGLFYFSPYTRISSEAGPAEKAVSIHYHFGGVISIWELLLLGMLLLLLTRNALGGRLTLPLGPWTGVFFLVLILTFAFASGLLHSTAGPLRYGITGARRPLIAYSAVFYLFATYLIVLNAIRTRLHLRQMLHWLNYLTIALVIYGFIRLILMLTGSIPGMWLFGLPVVLYDQMLMLYVPIFALISNWLHKGRLGAGRTLILASLMFFIVCSTRRFNYLLLIAGLIFVLALGWRLQMWPGRRTGKVVAGMTACMAALLLALHLVIPHAAGGVARAVQSINAFSKIGQVNSGKMRLAELGNLLRNLDERPYAYLTGFGMGTMWRSIDYQPVDPLTRKLRPRYNWYTQFHLPYISIVFRLGILGAFVFGIWFWCYVSEHLRRLRTVRTPLQPVYLAVLAFIFFLLPSLLDSFSPTGWSLCGLYAALAERMANLYGARGAIGRY